MPRRFNRHNRTAPGMRSDLSDLNTYWKSPYRMTNIQMCRSGGIATMPPAPGKKWLIFALRDAKLRGYAAPIFFVAHAPDLMNCPKSPR